jgi:enoyl-CoA hydratase/carnithine racemase
MNQKFKLLSIESQGEVTRVAINRTMDRNSINSELMEELTLALAEIEKSKARAVIFTGAGNTYFIGGADGLEMVQCPPHEAQAFSRRIQGLFDRMEQSPLILLAAINGLCFGGGFEFALACDLRVAADTARIGLPETKVGIIPGGGGTQRLPALVGAGLAMEMILTGRLYKAPKAMEMGLIHACTPAGELLEKSLDFLKPVLTQPQHALSQAKRAVKASARLGLDAGLLQESQNFSECFKESYFKKLMKEQLKSGALTTTLKLPDEFLS